MIKRVIRITKSEIIRENTISSYETDVVTLFFCHWDHVYTHSVELIKRIRFIGFRNFLFFFSILSRIILIGNLLWFIVIISHIIDTRNSRDAHALSIYNRELPKVTIQSRSGSRNSLTEYLDFLRPRVH